MSAMADPGDLGGKARREQRADRRECSAETEGFTPANALEIVVNGPNTSVSVPVDVLGGGDLDRGDRVAEAVGDLPFVDGLPDLQAANHVVAGRSNGAPGHDWMNTAAASGRRGFTWNKGERK